VCARINQCGAGLHGSGVVIAGYALNERNHCGVDPAVAPVSLPREEANCGWDWTRDSSALQVAFDQRPGRGRSVAPGLEGSRNLRWLRTRRDNDVARDVHYGGDAGNFTTGVAEDRNALPLNGDFKCRLGVAASGAAPAPFVVTPAGEIEVRRCFGNNVYDAHGSIHHGRAAKSPCQTEGSERLALQTYGVAGARHGARPTRPTALAPRAIVPRSLADKVPDGRHASAAGRRRAHPNGQAYADCAAVRRQALPSLEIPRGSVQILTWRLPARMFRAHTSPFRESQLRGGITANWRGFFPYVVK
jgi:hypothetical protein